VNGIVAFSFLFFLVTDAYVYFAERVATTIARFCDLKPVFELEEFLEGWFFGRPITSIPRDNIEEFVAYGFYCLPPDRLSEEQRQKMDAFLQHAVER
jgi:hypothetical protein